MEKTFPTDGKFSLQALPYPLDALAPVMSAETLSLHHGKHLQTYVNNLNSLVVGTQWEGRALEDIVEGSTGGLFNNAGQALNHNLYFAQFHAPREGNVPSGRIGELIDGQWGGFEAFAAEFEKLGASLFGSGWVWLSQDSDGKLVISQEPNAGNPLARKLRPLLGVDVWEHAYYVDYRNRRPEYLHATWQIVDWGVVESRLG